MPRDTRTGLLFAAAGTLVFAACGPMIKAASGHASPEALVFLRMLLAAVLLAALARLLGAPLAAPSDARAGFALAGLVAALHFGLFMASLYHTSVARSLALNYLSPAWTFLALAAVGRAGPARAALPRLACLAADLLGTVLLVSGGDPAALAGRFNRGDLYALLGGVALSAWHLLGARLSSRAGALAYAFHAYLVAALAFLPLFALDPGRFACDFSPRLLGLVVSLALLPTAAGHTLVAAALARAPAPLVSLVTTQEVAGGALLAAFALGESLAAAECAGLALSLAGLACFYLLEPAVNGRCAS